jgi:hypothetical protein
VGFPRDDTAPEQNDHPAGGRPEAGRQAFHDLRPASGNLALFLDRRQKIHEPEQLSRFLSPVQIALGTEKINLRHPGEQQR